MLVDRLRDEGRWLFRRRSVVPLALLPFVALALPASARVMAAAGPAGSRAIVWAGILIALAGQALRTTAVSFAPDGTSSRDTHRLRAPVLNTTGLYATVRHPLYVGNAIVWVGIAATLGVWWLAVVVALVHWVYIERVMMAEEAFLDETFGADFHQWASRTPAFLPRFAAWVPPAGVFSLKRLAAEHNGLLAIAIAVPLFNYLAALTAGFVSPADWAASHRDLVALLAAALVVSTVAVIAKRTIRPAP